MYGDVQTRLQSVISLQILSAIIVQVARTRGRPEYARPTRRHLVGMVVITQGLRWRENGNRESSTRSLMGGLSKTKDFNHS